MRKGRLATANAFAVLLDGRARHGAIGAEHAAVTRLRFQPSAAAVAAVEELAGIGWHGLEGSVAAGRTGEG